jgi:hypothetical protein
LLAAFLIWPPLTAWMMAWFTCLNGRAIKRRTGKRIGRQMLEQLYLAAAHDILPPWYYIFELFEDGKRRQAAGYLHRFETKGSIYRFLKRTPRDATRTPLGNKLHFAVWCHRHGITSAPVLFAAEKGEFLSTFRRRATRRCRPGTSSSSRPAVVADSERSAGTATGMALPRWPRACVLTGRGCSSTSGDGPRATAASCNRGW